MLAEAVGELGVRDRVRAAGAQVALDGAPVGGIVEVERHLPLDP
jgi:signal transduction histidine kinase